MKSVLFFLILTTFSICAVADTANVPRVKNFKAIFVFFSLKEMRLATPDTYSLSTDAFLKVHVQRVKECTTKIPVYPRFPLSNFISSTKTNKLTDTPIGFLTTKR